ncbi:MAG: tetratricopeptide repeat protein [Clostridia bacterium]|nr:tetratricopeptide repeat protein [Clostridia bacterium]
MKKIKIFIGSSIDELANERNEIARFMLGLNNEYIDKDIYFEVYFCEETSSVMQAEGSQKQHNDYIEKDADAAIFMFFNKAGRFTLEELDLARKAFLEGMRPNIFVFFKAVDSYPAATEEIKACVSKVANDYGHYFKMFDSTDTIKLELLQYLVESLPGAELSVENGIVYLGGEAVENIDAQNVFAYQNNGNLKKLKKQSAELLTKMTEASARGDVAEALKISVELEKVQKTYHTLEKDILDMLRKFFEENKKGNKANPRRMEALRLLELGKIEEAKALIPQEELDRRTESFKGKQDLIEKQLADEANDIVEDALIRIEALKQDVENINRFKEIETVYDGIYKTAQTAKRYDVLYDFAVFLHNDQKNYSKGITIAENLKYLYDDPNKKVESLQKAKLFNLLGELYKANNNYAESLKIYLESHKIYKTYVKNSSNYYASSIGFAMVLKNLADLYSDLDKNDNAESFLLEALKISQDLTDKYNNPDCKTIVADVCDSLAFVQMRMKKKDKAEKLYRKSLIIRIKLKEEYKKPDYKAKVAESYNNIAIFYRYAYADRQNEAEELCRKALEIYCYLAETVSKSAYEPMVASATQNLAIHYAENGKLDEAANLFLEALELYQRLADMVSKSAYEPFVATICFNLANLYSDTDKSHEAEDLYLKSLEIERRIVETDDAECKLANEPYIAIICENLAEFYLNTGKVHKADKYYIEAENIAKKYKGSDSIYGSICRRICDKND